MQRGRTWLIIGTASLVLSANDQRMEAAPVDYTSDKIPGAKDGGSSSIFRLSLAAYDAEITFYSRGGIRNSGNAKAICKSSKILLGELDRIAR